GFRASASAWGPRPMPGKAATPLPRRTDMIRAGGSFALLLALTVPGLAQQSTQSDPAGFGGLAEEAGEEVNVSADDLEIDENESTALFTGNVVITQGTMQLQAPRVLA